MLLDQVAVSSSFPPTHPSLPIGDQEPNMYFQASNQRALSKATPDTGINLLKRMNSSQAHPKGKSNRKSYLIKQPLNESTFDVPTQNIQPQMSKLCEINPCWEKDSEEEERGTFGVLRSPSWQ